MTNVEFAASVPQEPPHNFAAEQSVLGAILLNNAAWPQVGETLRPEHFADPLHGRLWEAVCRLIGRGQMASIFTLRTYAEQDADLKAVGGPAYLARLLASSVHAADVPAMARVVHDCASRRRLIATLHEALPMAYDTTAEQSASEQIEALEQRLYGIAEDATDDGFQSFRRSLTDAITAADAAYKRDTRLVGLSTGLGTLDHVLGGLYRSDLVILAGRPSAGKSALATNIAYHVARAHRTEEQDGRLATVDGGVVGFFSLEMSAEQLATRIIAEQAAVPSERIRRGELNAAEFDRVLERSGDLEAIPLYIDDTPALTIGALRTRARRLKRTHGLGLLVVDYLQLLTPAERRRQGNRVEEVSEITRGLKTLAKELDVPVLALSQLSRAVEQREDKRPQLADLRESGSIEQDADVVMFIYREEYYARREEPQQRTDESEERFTERMKRWQNRMMNCAGRAEVIVDKQRHGPVGKALLRFDGALTRFSDME